MPTLDFRYISLVQALEDDLLLAEPLFFPDVSTLGDDQPRLVEVLGNHVQTSLEALPAKEIHRHRAAGALRTAQIEVEVSPLRATIGWGEPVTLTFHYVEWEHGEEAHIAYVPALGIETMAATARGLEKKLPQEIRAALFRRGVAKSLRKVVELQRIRDIEAVESQVAVMVRSPLDEREQADARKPSKSVLKDVATALTPGLVGRAFEVSEPVARLAEALSGVHRPGVLLVGPSGVGKTAVVHELVARRREFRLGKTPFWSTSGARLVAGMSGYGMWQERCQKIVKEASATRAVLHVESLVELMGVGKGSLNEQGIAAFFRPYIERGDLQVVTECVPEQIPVIEREEPQLLAVLQRIEIAQPTGEQSGAILRRAAGERADSITDEAIATIDRLHRRFATYSAHPGRPLRFLKNLLSPQGEEEVEMVTERDVVAAFAEETGLPRFLLDGDEPLRLEATQDFFSRRVMGQQRAVDLMVDVLATVKAGLTPAGRPISSMLFIGPTGVGKTEMAKALAEFMYQSPARMIRVDMSEYVDRHSVDRLIGGSLTAEGLLTAKIREQPFSVVLLDEFEKAHASFFDLLLQVLGEGRLTDGAGRVASFGNAIILMTSNLGVDTFGRASPGFQSAADRLAQSERHFVDRVQEFVRPEFFNRIDRIVPFAPLDRTTIRAIARRELDKVWSRDGIRNRRLALEVDPAVVDFLADRGYEPQYGARPLQRAIDRRLVTRLAECANRYAADLAIEVRAEMVDGAVSASARARPTGERGSASAGTSDHGRLDLASKVTLLRRRVQLLNVSSFMQDIRNELQRLEHQQRRLKKMGRGGGIAGRNAALAAADTSVRRLRERVRDMAALMARASRLEAEVLSAFYADGALDVDLPRTSMQAITDEFERLAMAGLVEIEDPPERITLVISGEDRRGIADLAAAYLAVVAGRGGKPALSELHRHPPLRTSESLGHVPGLSPERTIYARPIRDAARYLASPPESLLGAAVSVSGRTFNLFLGSEHGNHVFRIRGTPDRYCRVDVVAGRVVDYRLPARFGRRDATENLETRRVYDFSEECVFDSGQRFRFGAKYSIDDALSAAVGRRVSDMIDAGLGEW